MDESKREQLPDQYIDIDARNKCSEDIKNIEEWINNTFKEAVEKEGLLFSIELIKELCKSPEEVTSIMNKNKEAYVKTLGFVPVNERQRIEQNYTDVANRLLRFNELLYGYMKQYPFNLTRLKNGKITFDSKEVANYIESLGVRIFTPEEKEYIELLQDAAELLKKIDTLEKERSYPPYAMKSVTVLYGANGIIPITEGLTADLSQGRSIIDRFAKKSSFKTFAAIQAENSK